MFDPNSLKQPKQLQIRPALAHEIPLVYQLAHLEGWNFGVDDMWVATQAMLNSFLVGTVDDQVVACRAITRYQTGFTYCSFLLVDPEFRGLGYGRRLWAAALENAGSTNIIIDTMPGKDQWAREYGFQPSDIFCSYHLDSHTQDDTSHHPLPIFPVQSFLSDVLTYDEPFFPAPRRPYMTTWLNMPHAKAFVWYENNTVQGYGVIRKANQGYRIGPLYADHSEIASHLFRALITGLQNEPIALSMPEQSPLTQSFVKEFQLRATVRLQRWYSKFPLTIPYNKIAAITNFTYG
jgi:GNAT superfamily N-acetyltransferase